MCPIRYFNWTHVPDDLKEGCWRLVLSKYWAPRDPIAYAGLKKYTLQKIGKSWRDHRCTLKKEHYIPDERNKARVKNNPPKGSIVEDWHALVDYWYTLEVMEEAEKNKDRRSQQEDLHTAGSCSYVVHANKKSKEIGRPVERAEMYPEMHTRKDGQQLMMQQKGKCKNLVNSKRWSKE